MIFLLKKKFMSNRTKKVGSAGRFGVRYGLKSRKEVIAVDRSLKQKHKCPNCLKPGVRRVKAGVWNCTQCGLKFAGRAYRPS